MKAIVFKRKTGKIKIIDNEVFNFVEKYVFFSTYSAIKFWERNEKMNFTIFLKIKAKWQEIDIKTLRKEVKNG